MVDDDLATKRIKTNGSGSDMGQRSRQNDSRAVMQGLATSTQPEVSSISSPHHRDGVAAHGKENIAPHHHLKDEQPDQEDGYMSPPPSYLRSATPDLSSPVGFRVEPRGHGSADDFGADVISSPLATKRRSPWFHERSASPRDPVNLGNILVPGTPPSVEADIGGPDLRDILSICSTDEIEELEGHETSGAVAPSRPEDVSAETIISEDQGLDTSACSTRMHAVASGWRNKWAMKQESHSAHVSKPRGLLSIH